MKPKHHLIISALILACLMLLANAKKKEVNKSIRWDERLLNWDDFPIIGGIPGDFHAMVYSDIQFEGNRDEKYLHIYARMLPFKSGRVVKDELETEQLLIHEQHHFDITEYHARLFRKEAIGIGIDKLTNDKLQHLGKKYLNEINAMQDRYDKESKHNTEWNSQRYWELYIAGLLRETAYYANQDLYSYQDFYAKPTAWYRKIYNTLEGELLTSYPEKTINSHFGEIYHVERKRDSTLIKFYKDGKPTNGGYFKAALSIITFPNATTSEVHLFDTQNKAFSNKTEAHITRTLRDTENNITRTYYDGNGEQISIQGIFTLKGAWNAAKKSMYSSYFDKDNNPVMREGAYHELREMGANKVTNRISYFNKAGKPMYDNAFVSIYEYETDDNLMVTRAKLFDVDGKYAITGDVYNIVYHYDERGEIKSKSYFDEMGNKTADIDGVHNYTFSYDLYGNCTDIRKFNLRGLPTKGVDNYHQQVNLYDTVGRLTFNAKYYPNYVLIFNENKEGATTYTYLGDSIVTMKNVDAFGRESMDDMGISQTKQFLNDKKKVVTEEYFDTKGSWAKTENAVVSYTYKYDERGNKTEMTGLDSLGKPRVWQEDVATTRWEYDKNNNKILTTYFTEDNELANAAQGTTYNVFKYDEDNNLSERTNFDKNMNPSLFDGVFRTNIVLNRFGTDSIVTSYNINNQIVAGGGIIKYTYNTRGLLESERFYNQQNQPVLNELGVHKTIYNRDKFDRYLGYSNYGINGESVNNNEGISSSEMRLTASGYMRSLSYYNNRKKPVIGPEGYHSLEYHYNDMDELVRISTYGSDKKLLNDANGIADFIYQIDESGRTLRISFYNADGNLTEDSNGIAEYMYKPSLNGLYYLEKQLDAQGLEVVEDEV